MAAMLLGTMSLADYKPGLNLKGNANQLLSNCKEWKKLGMIFIILPHDIRWVNEQTLMALLIYANPKLKNPEWSIAGFMSILVQIKSTA